MPQTPTATPRRRRAAPTAPVAAPRHMQVRLERLDDGRVRLSTPQARGAAYVAKGPYQMWHALSALWRDAAAAGQAAWEGRRTDLDWLTERDDPTEPERRRLPSTSERAARKRAVGYSYRDVVRPDQADPGAWWPDPPEQPGTPDGELVRPWRSPNGRRWTAVKVLRPLLAKRELLGLPTTYEAWLEAQEQAAPEPDEAPAAEEASA